MKKITLLILFFYMVVVFSVSSLEFTSLTDGNGGVPIVNGIIDEYLMIESEYNGLYFVYIINGNLNINCSIDNGESFSDIFLGYGEITSIANIKSLNLDQNRWVLTFTGIENGKNNIYAYSLFDRTSAIPVFMGKLNDISSSPITEYQLLSDVMLNFSIIFNQGNRLGYYFYNGIQKKRNM